MTLTIPSSGLIPLESFKKLLDISRVVYYSLEDRDGSLHLIFYDKNKKVIKPYVWSKGYAKKEKASKNKSKKPKK